MKVTLNLRTWVLVWITALLAAGCLAAPANVVPETDLESTSTAALSAPEASPTSNPTASPTAPPTEMTEPAAIPTALPTEITGPSATPGAAADSAIRFEIAQPGSKARYLVREQLANLTLPNDAVGETGQFSGAIVLNPDGAIDPVASQFVVDMTSLISDSSRRDSYLQRNVLRTGQYPQAVFIPTHVVGLPAPLPQSGPVDFQLVGDLTLLDVTREVSWAVSGTVEGDQAVGQATTSFTFADFNLTQPRVPMVLSIEDEIRLELDLVLQKVAGPASGQ